MFGQKTKRIKELEAQVAKLKNELEWSDSLFANAQNESFALRTQNNILRSKIPVHGANGRFIPKV